MILMNWSKAEGESPDGMARPMFLKSSSVCHKMWSNLKPAPQAEAPGQAKRPPSQKGWGGVPQSTICTVPWGCNLPKPISPIATAPRDPEMQASWLPEPGESRGIRQAAAPQTGATDIKTRVPTIYKASLQATLKHF